MTSIIQSIFACLFGAVLSLLGVLHSVSRYPGSEVFQQVLYVFPQLGLSLFFVLGIAAALGGTVMLGLSLRRLRHRWRHVQALTGHRRPRGYDDERDYHDQYH